MNYVAVWGANNARIMSTSADNTEDAIAEITRQLSKPGRWGVLRVWQEHGSKVIEAQSPPQPPTPSITAQDRARARERWER